jgi:hypothetical protein
MKRSKKAIAILENRQRSPSSLNKEMLLLDDEYNLPISSGFT